MRFVARDIQPLVAEAARSFPALVLTGPRRAGKTTLLRRLFPGASYTLLEDPDVLARARSDPRGLLDSVRLPAVFDEIQNAPELFPYIRSRIDRNPPKPEVALHRLPGGPAHAGRHRVDGRTRGHPPTSPSQRFRNAIGSSLLAGGYPEALARPRARDLWFSSYIQTYLERDVRAIVSVRDLATFRRFLALVASRHGQVLNRTDLAAPLGVSVPTINEWLHILEITGQIILAPPYFENFGKRLIKSPKVYIMDSRHGVPPARHPDASRVEPFPVPGGALGRASSPREILKRQVNRGRRKELYHFRDQQGLEVDFLFPDSKGKLWMVECKASKTVLPSMAGPIESLRRSIGKPVRAAIVHQKAKDPLPTRSLAPGIEALDLKQLLVSLV